MEIFSAELEGVPTARPRDGIVRLPDLVVKTLAGFRVAQIQVTIVAKIESQKSIEARRVTISDTDGIAELGQRSDPNWYRYLA